RSAAGYIGPVPGVQSERSGADDARQCAADVAAVPLLGVTGEIAEKVAEALAPEARLAEIAENLAREEPAAADPVRIDGRRSQRMARGRPGIEDGEVDPRADRELEAPPEAGVDLEQLRGAVARIDLPLDHRDPPPVEAAQEREA